MRVAILGGGNGGYTMAADLKLRGFDVSLYELPEFEENIRPVQEKGCIQLSGAAGEGPAEVRATTDIKAAIEDAEVIMVVVPSFGHERFADTCIPYIKSGQMIVINTGNFGSLVFARKFKEKGIDITRDVVLGETLILVYATRRMSSNQVFVFGVKQNLPFAALPSKRTPEALAVLNKMFPQFVPAVNVFETSINNPNVINHPTQMILNAARIEATGGQFDWREPTPPSLATLRDAVDEEKMAVARALGLKAMPYKTIHKTLYSKPSLLPEKFLGAATDSAKFLETPKIVKMRYLTEDVPYGLVPIASIADVLNVQTPTIDSLIQIASVVNQTNYWRDGRTAEKLGLAGLNVDEMNKLVAAGRI